MDSRHSENQPRTVTASALIASARRWQGTPYLHQGRNCAGVDCVGFIIGVMQELELLPESFERADYGRMPTGELLAKVREYCSPLEHDEPGSLVMIKWPSEKEPSHCALRTDRGLIHALDRHGGVKEHGYRAHWPRWTHSHWWPPGVVRG